MRRRETQPGSGSAAPRGIWSLGPHPPTPGSASEAFSVISCHCTAGALGILGRHPQPRRCAGYRQPRVARTEVRLRGGLASATPSTPVAAGQTAPSGRRHLKQVTEGMPSAFEAAAAMVFVSTEAKSWPGDRPLCHLTVILNRQHLCLRPVPGACKRAPPAPGSCRVGTRLHRSEKSDGAGGGRGLSRPQELAAPSAFVRKQKRLLKHRRRTRAARSPSNKSPPAFSKCHRPH